MGRTVALKDTIEHLGCVRGKYKEEDCWKISLYIAVQGITRDLYCKIYMDRREYVVKIFHVLFKLLESEGARYKI